MEQAGHERAAERTRSSIRLGGCAYDVRPITDLSQAELVELRDLLRLRRRPARVRRALRRCVEILVPALDPDVLDRLDDQEHRRVVDELVKGAAA